MKKLLLILLAAVFIGCKNEKKDKQEVVEVKQPTIDSMLITDSSWGPITASTDFEKLVAAYGKDWVEDRRVCDIECQDSINITVILPNTHNESTVYWKDNAYHKTIDRVECYWDSATWHTDKGIRMRSGLAELVKLNGKKINFYGFGWDYGGTITSYNEGALERSQVFYIMSIDDYSAEKLLGEIDLDSDMPEVKKHMDKITIRSISLAMNRSEH
jgi:hypothetical protein